jgi:uncharacterized protein YecT (DUF1311 family)
MKLLVEAQRSWLTIRKRTALSSEGGDNGDVAVALCMLRTTMQRLAELEALLPQPRELTRPKDGPVTQAG